MATIEEIKERLTKVKNSMDYEYIKAKQRIIDAVESDDVDNAENAFGDMKLSRMGRDIAITMLGELNNET